MTDYVDEFGTPQPERRSGEERRKLPTRRESIRWEPEKVDRRSGKDRRKDLTGGWNQTPRK